MQPLRQSILDMEAIMSVADIYEKRATFSFEVFPPKTDVGMEKLCGKDGVLDKLYTLEPDYISCCSACISRRRARSRRTASAPL